MMSDMTDNCSIVPVNSAFIPIAAIRATVGTISATACVLLVTLINPNYPSFEQLLFAGRAFTFTHAHGVNWDACDANRDVRKLKFLRR